MVQSKLASIFELAATSFMVDNQNLLTLSRRFDDIISNYPLKLHKYIHTRSVRNFLFQLDKLESEWTRQRIYHQLDNYFDLIAESFIEDNSESIMLYDKFILPIAKTFDQCIQLHLVIKIRFVVMFSLIPLILLYLFDSSLYLLFLLVAIDIASYVRQLFYENQRSSYGPFY